MFNPQMIVNMMIQQNPQLAKVWEQAQQMAQGKTPEEGMKMIHNIADQQNINLDNIWEQMVKQFNIQGVIDTPHD